MRYGLTIVERMNGDIPEMCDSRFEDGIVGSVVVEPVDKVIHFGAEFFRPRGFVVDALAPKGSRDNLHRAGAIVAPCVGFDLGHATASGRK